jgi:hypothetical protein
MFVDPRTFLQIFLLQIFLLHVADGRAIQQVMEIAPKIDNNPGDA